MRRKKCASSGGGGKEKLEAFIERVNSCGKMKRKEDPRSHYGPLFLLGEGEGVIRFVIGVVFWSQLFDNECGRLLIFFGPSSSLLC